jgi:hypothetical protein
MRLFADSNGNLIYFLGVLGQNTPLGTPANAVSSLDFDATTNSALVADLQANVVGMAIPAYTISGGNLLKDGMAVAIAAPGADYQTRQLIGQVVSTLASGQFQGTAVTATQANTAWTAIQAGTATSAQVQQFLVFLARLQALAFKKMLASGAI